MTELFEGGILKGRIREKARQRGVLEKCDRSHCHNGHLRCPRPVSSIPLLPYRTPPSVFTMTVKKKKKKKRSTSGTKTEYEIDLAEIRMGKHRQKINNASCLVADKRIRSLRPPRGSAGGGAWQSRGLKLSPGPVEVVPRGVDLLDQRPVLVLGRVAVQTGGLADATQDPVPRFVGVVLHHLVQAVVRAAQH